MTSYPDLRTRVALVTGGNRGIGRAIARALGAEGVNVAIVAHRHAEEAASVAAEIEQGGARAFSTLADLTTGAEAERVVREAADRLGPVEILVNCAGGFPASRLVVDTGEDEWDAILAVNLKSAFVCSKAVLPGMMERGWGRIINISSEVGRMPVALTAAHYAASKAGMLGLTRHLAREVASYGITVNATAPGTTYSERVRGRASPEFVANASRLTPAGRIGEVDEQAGIVVFLASEAAGYITGATIDVSGGKVML